MVGGTIGSGLGYGGVAVAQEDHIRFALFCKTVSGASDNLRAWWKEKVKFDRNGLAAIAKYQADNLSLGNLRIALQWPPLLIPCKSSRTLLLAHFCQL
ncbi:hypothetical protein RJ639_013277 [Escallonia herrerae]|uniref:Ethylene insensitive 3-like DNA-binding domain-containing protein n=1 Tax=Escallonia herrerae TaxID=1293975 RepID=A0AA88VJX3_9ASTE|nr:hypothetical protein RJ639_013277 [Escallonia herrerae]